MYSTSKEKEHKCLLEQVPIFWTENLGRDFVVIGSVSAQSAYKTLAEISLVEQARKLGADAIICSPLGASTSVHSRKNKEVSSSTTFHYNGSAIKFKDSNQETNINIEQQENEGINIEQQENIYEEELNKLLLLKNNAPEHIINLENDLVLDIDKQKKLLENGIIDDIEFKNRIDISKNKFLEEKKYIDGLDSSIEKILVLKELEDKKIAERKELEKELRNENRIKELENEATLKIEKQKRCFNMNVIDKKEYDKEINLIQMELEEKKRQLKN